jgi:hypothetical protein
LNQSAARYDKQLDRTSAGDRAGQVSSRGGGVKGGLLLDCDFGSLTALLIGIGATSWLALGGL